MKLIISTSLFVLITSCSNKEAPTEPDQFNQVILEFAKKLEEQENKHIHTKIIIDSQSNL